MKVKALVSFAGAKYIEEVKGTKTEKNESKRVKC